MCIDFFIDFFKSIFPYVFVVTYDIYLSSSVNAVEQQKKLDVVSIKQEMDETLGMLYEPNVFES